MTAIAELIARWDSDEGKPYKGSLIDFSSYEEGSLSCMCAQGQVLHVVAGWSVDDLRNTSQAEADMATAKALNISRAHAVLLRSVNDKADGAPSIVLTDPAKVLGDRWGEWLDFWHYIDGLGNDVWQKVAADGVAAGDAGAAAWDAARYAAWDASRDAARYAAWDAAGAAAWDAARDAAGTAAWTAAWGAAREIQGAALLPSFFFLPMFGFATPADIPARPSDYGLVA